MTRLVLSSVLLTVAAGGWFAWTAIEPARASPPTFRTAAVAPRDLASGIDATGTVEPDEVVDVGAQVAGQILSFGTDADGKPVDYGSRVEAGTVLATIDDSLYAADLAAAQAQLQAAKAGVARADADLLQVQAKLVQAEADWHRAERLGPSDALSQTAYDAFRTGYAVAQADVEVARAAVQQAAAAVPLAAAAVQKSQRNVDYCVIRSPVRGVIVDRRVDIGQTVVSSLNAPSLFLIARDLHHVRVWAAVAEADVCGVHAGQRATFTVDALPGRVFAGTVAKVRLGAAMTQNVVTYTVEVAADNQDGALLPYLTANVHFVVAEHRGVLAAPAAALQYVPRPELVEPHARAAAAATEGAHLYVPAGDGRLLQPVAVTVGLADGAFTEVAGDGIRAGLQVVLGERSDGAETAAPAAGGSPFTPAPRGARGAR